MIHTGCAALGGSQQTESEAKKMTQEIEIVRLAHGGDGVGALEDGVVVFVPEVLPGEVVKAEVVQRKKSFARAKATEWIRTSPERISPPCPHAHDCGGCQLQHVSPPAQLPLKAQAAWVALSRLSRLGDALRPFDALLGATDGRMWRWRTRCTWRVQAQRQGGWLIGFVARQSAHIVDQSECRVLVAPLEQVRELLPQVLGAVHRGEVFAETATSEQVSIRLQNALWSRHGGKLGQFKQDAKVWQKKHEDLVRNVYHGDELVAGVPGVSASEAMSAWDASSFAGEFLSSGLFRQTHRTQNQALVAHVCEQVGAAGRVLELFCGVGNMSFPMVQEGGVGELVGLESVKACVVEGIALANARGLPMRFLQRDLDEHGWDMDVHKERWDVVVLDPTRAGAAVAVDALVKWPVPAEKIVYVSCEPASLGRDLEVLSQRYEVVNLVAVDLFPHTAHVEVVATLKVREEA